MKRVEVVTRAVPRKEIVYIEGRRFYLSNCPWCGGRFASKNYNAITCSKECAGHVSAARAKNHGHLHPVRKGVTARNEGRTKEILKTYRPKLVSLSGACQQ